MNKGFSEREILELLDHLKSEGNEYPSEMIRTRREVFIKQATAMAVSAGPSGGNGGSAAGSISSGLESFTLGRLLEIALALILAAGVGITVYLYRDTITDIISSTLFPKTDFTAVPSQDISSEPADMPVTDQEDASETLESVPAPGSSPGAGSTEAVAGTPAPSLVPDAGQNADAAPDTNSEGFNATGAVEGQATPTPDDKPGLHLGQTPKPERTLPPNENSPPNYDDKSPKKDKSP